MKKAYIQPDIEMLKLSVVADDFLTTSYDPEDGEEDKTGMGNSQGEIIPGKVPSLH